MGNAINSRLFSGRAETEWKPNIPVDNNLNRPHSVQVTDVVLHYAVPVIFMVALAVRENQQRAREETLTRNHKLTLKQLVAIPNDKPQELMELSRTEHSKRNDGQQNLSDKITALKQEEEKKRQQQLERLKVYNKISDKITTLEQEQEKKHQQQLERLKVYDKGLEHILDIQCSLFKEKALRTQVEAELDERLYVKDGDLAALLYPGLRSVMKHDKKFCGTSKETNGKLRQVYAQNWRLQLELDKHKALLNKIKEATKPNS